VLTALSATVDFNHVEAQPFEAEENNNLELLPD
jgi:hypothetical protein